MRTGKPVFAQMIGFLPMHAPRCCSGRHDGNRRVWRSSGLDRFRSMAFARLTSMESLCTKAGKFQRIGCRSPVSRQAVPKRTARPDLFTVTASKSGLRPDIFGRVSSWMANSHFVQWVMPEHSAVAVSGFWVRVPAKMRPFLQMVPVPGVLASTCGTASSAPLGIANPECLHSFPACRSGLTPEWKRRLFAGSTRGIS